MSLRGSLDTFALPDVLALLASTAKTGELHVDGPLGAGRLWLDRGQVVGAESPGTTDLVEVLVDLLRLDEGDFSFHGDRVSPAPQAPVEVTAVLEQAATRLAEWEEVERVLPSADAVLTLAPTVTATVRLSRDQWAAVAAIGDGRAVERLVDRLGGDELAGWRLLAGLVETGMVEVGARPAVPAVRRHEVAEQLATLSAEAVTEERPPVRESVESDVVDDFHEDAGHAGQHEAAADEADDEVPEEAPDDARPAVPATAAAQAIDPADGVSRGTLLKFLSSVRS
jgi:hypothetical protein